MKMNNKQIVRISAIVAVLLAGAPLHAGSIRGKKATEPPVAAELQQESSEPIYVNNSTKTVGFAKLKKVKGNVAPRSDEDKKDKAKGFLKKHNKAFGLVDADAELKDKHINT